MLRDYRKYPLTKWEIIEKMFPLKPDIFLPFAFTGPVLCFVLCRFIWVSYIMAGYWIITFAALCERPQRNAPLIEWVLLVIRIIGALALTVVLLIVTIVSFFRS